MIVTVSTTPSVDVHVISALPAPTAVIIPLELTFATPSFEDAKFPVSPVTKVALYVLVNDILCPFATPLFSSPKYFAMAVAVAVETFF